MQKWKILTPMLAVVLMANQCRPTLAARTRPTPAPVFTGPSGRAANAGEVATYVARLEFDSSAIASDAQHFIVGTTRVPVIGPWARIAPEIGSTGLTEAQLASGRIIARVTVQAGLAAVEPTATLYIFVHRDGANWFATLLAADSGIVSGPNPMPLHPHAVRDTTLRAQPRAVWIQPRGPTPSAITIPTFCTLCTESYGWCGRDVDSFQDTRTWAYVNGKLGTSFPIRP